MVTTTAFRGWGARLARTATPAQSFEQMGVRHRESAAHLATAQILDAEDFKEIGIKVGTRKKLLERLASSTSEA